MDLLFVTNENGENGPFWSSKQIQSKFTVIKLPIVNLSKSNCIYTVIAKLRKFTY